MKPINRKTVKRYLKFLFENNIISKVDDYSRFFSDEPIFFRYISSLNDQNPRFETRGYFVDLDEVTTSGVSYDSRETALFKCLAEAMERFCQHCFLEEFTYDSKITELKKPFLDPTVFWPGSDFAKMTFSWTAGRELTENKELLIPTQLVYLNYFKHAKSEELLLGQMNSSGTAGAFTHDEAVVSAIFEIIERDAFMGVYLNKIKPFKVDLKYINDQKIKNITADLERNYMVPYVFNITTDLEVPVFLAIIIDTTDEKPHFTIGAKCGFDEIHAVKGALEEAVMPRVWLRSEMLKASRVNNIRPNQINTFLKRALFWNSGKSIMTELDFLLKQPQKRLVLKKSKKSNDLKKILTNLKNKGLKIYDKDITVPEIMRAGYYVHRVIIPGLQPLYLDEQYKEMNVSRLKKISDHFGARFGKINNIPHPFL